ncbi:hypothetical protein PFHG_00512 [Plasmodium falciparum HB3]|uniref:Uncharacterized protein n=1 Tax=Plasmodium falciparum (isolate HB3) TaxID=137071 RepID=A0A0L7K6S3_PLAFX|nr:hypothetical protein PFHG_00512 [Plasmodium falciparum HB3]
MSISSYNYLFACDTSCKKLINSTSPAAALHGVTKNILKRKKKEKETIQVYAYIYIYIYV